MRRTLLFLLLLLPAAIRAQLPNIAIVATASASYPTYLPDVKAKLTSTGMFGTIDIYNIVNVTPTLAQLQAYKAVLFFTDGTAVANATQLSTNLAAYVNGGGGLVNAVFSAQYSIGGALNTATYQVTSGGNSVYGTRRYMGTVPAPVHPIMEGVASFNGGYGSYRSTTSYLNPNSTVAAYWDDNAYLVAYRNNVGAMNVNRVDLNFWPVSSDVHSQGWQNSDAPRLMANALRYVINSVTTGTLSSNSLTPGSTVQVPFTAFGTYPAGNVFTAQLSNEYGNFGNSQNIGSVTSSAPSGTITATIPVNVSVSQSYRIRVVASNPGVTGTANPSPVFMSKAANSLHFDGVDDYVSVDDHSRLQLTDNFTLECWFNAASLTNARFFDKGVAGSTVGYSLGISNGKLNFYNDGINLSGSTTLVANQWYHAAITFNASEPNGCKLYLNGVVDAQGTATGPGSVTASPLYFGKVAADPSSLNPPLFNGLIDEARVWNRIVCGAEVTHNKNGSLRAGYAYAHPGLIACYRFNEGVGAGLNTAATAPDEASYYHPGTLYNFTLSGGSSNWMTGAPAVATELYPYTTYNTADFSESQSQSVWSYTTFSGCGVMAAVNPAGSPQVNGNVTTKVRVSPTVPLYRGLPYVRRYFDITPDNNPNTATANITLYFSQADFDAYNAAPNTPLKLPTYSGDVNGIANLRILQQHGTSTSGLPGTYTYTGTGSPEVVIDPADNNIMWNWSSNRWDVTFPVTGFSGFFVYGGSGLAPLPVQLVSFDGEKAGAGRNLLRWNSASEDPGMQYVLERSADGRSFAALATVSGKGAASAYDYEDGAAAKGANYYRLRMTERDGSHHYSRTVQLSNEGGSGAITVWPTPVQQQLTVSNTDATLNGKAARIVDAQGRTLQLFSIAPTSSVDAEAWPAGIYSLHLPDGSVLKIVKQ